MQTSLLTTLEVLTTPLDAARTVLRLTFLWTVVVFFLTMTIFGLLAISLEPDAEHRGDIYLNLNSQANYLSSYEIGSAGFFLILHELGHTLG